MVRVDDALAAALPDVEPRDVRRIETGWDSVVLDVDGEWILRVARRDVVAARYGVETRLLPELAPLLPLPVPEPVRSGPGWILTRRLSGEPFAGNANAAPLGDFVASLHAFSISRARELGARNHELAPSIDRFRKRVLPLLDRNERTAARRLLDEHEAASFEPRLVHADLGPWNVLVDRGEITGVIDWTDIRVGDPAIDLAWPLQVAPEIAQTYPVEPALERRALVYYVVAPWHDVDAGIETGTARWVEDGLAEIRDRLSKAAGPGAGRRRRYGNHRA